jgi:HEAT repeat protein
MLAGLLPDATGFINVLRKLNLLLAAECIQVASKVDPSIVDAAIVEAVTQFKFGSEPFNYQLIFALKQIGDRRSSELDRRVIDDMEHWCKKFASIEPKVLDRVHTTDELLRIVSAGKSHYLMTDAIWTLGRERKELRAVNPLIDLLLDRNSPYRADAARALGELGDKRATTALLSCSNGKPEDLRPHCFMALGKIKDPHSLTPLIEYLSNLNNPFRETAAWALLGVADESIADFLISMLRKGNRYARANFVFLLGQHRMKKGLQPLIELFEVENSPFVREDIAFALGEYGDVRAVPVLLDRLDDTDVLVRIQVAVALAKIGCKEALPKLRELHSNESGFVKENIEEVIANLAEVPDSPYEVPETDLHEKYQSSEKEIMAQETDLQSQEYLSQLRQNLTKYFNEDELRTVCFDMKISYDDLPGEGLTGKARELVAFLQRRNQIAQLVEICSVQRPHIAWETLSE